MVLPRDNRILYQGQGVVEAFSQNRHRDQSCTACGLAAAVTKIPSQIQSRAKTVAQRNIPVVLLFLGLAIRGTPWLISPNTTLPNAAYGRQTRYLYMQLPAGL